MSPRSEELANDRVPRRALAAAGLALAVLAAVVYAQTGAFAFLDYDDPLVVTGNEVVQKGLGGESLRFAFQDTRMNLYHPLTWLSHMADVSLFGDWAGGHHLVNAALHLANGLLVLLLAVRVGGRPAPSFVVAALFVVHPMHVESVAWISERKDVLSTFFYLLTVLLYVRWTASRSRTLYGAALLSCLLGFLSKPGLMTLPFALLLLDCWPLRRLDPGDLRTLPRRILPLALEKAPFFLLAAVFMAVAWRIQSTGAHAGVADMTSFPERLALTGLGYASWLLRTVWPAGLSAFYPHPATIASAAVAASWAVLLAISFPALLLRRRAPWFLAGWGWFLLLLLPASGLVTISDNFAPDRYAYLAHLGLFVVIVGGAVALTGRLRLPTAVPAAAAAAAVVLLAAMAAVQTAHWKSSEGLWRHCLAVTSRNYFAHNKLAVHLLEAGREDEGLAHLRAAVEAQPDFAFAHANLGKVLAKRGELEAAIGHFERAIAVKPRDAAMRLALLPLLRDADRPPADTIAHLDALVALDPRDARLRYDLATVLQRAQRLEDALPHYLAAAALAPPSNFLIRGDLGAVLVQLGRFPEAIPHLRAAARQPDNPFAPRAHYLLGLAYHKTGQNERAIPALEAAVATDPAFRPARTALDGLRNNPAP